MLNNEDIIGKVKIAILIGIVIVAVMGCGCTEKYIVSLPSSDASPSEGVYVENVVEKKYPFPFNLTDKLIDELIDNKPKSKNNTINLTLTKEEDGWRLTDLYCELKGK